MENIRVPTAQGKRKMAPKKFPVRENTRNLEILSKHREFCLNTGKTQGIVSKHRDFFFSQVVKALILKVKDIAIFFEKLDRSAKSVLCM